MSPKQWLSLLTFYILYLIFGASVFYHVEHKLETDRRAMATSERIEINGNYSHILTLTENLVFNRYNIFSYCYISIVRVNLKLLFCVHLSILNG